jgi:hypothetical protein
MLTRILKFLYLFMWLAPISRICVRNLVDLTDDSGGRMSRNLLQGFLSLSMSMDTLLAVLAELHWHGFKLTISIP